MFKRSIGFPLLPLLAFCLLILGGCSATAAHSLGEATMQGGTFERTVTQTLETTERLASSVSSALETSSKLVAEAKLSAEEAAAAAGAAPGVGAIIGYSTAIAGAAAALLNAWRNATRAVDPRVSNLVKTNGGADGKAT